MYIVYYVAVSSIWNYMLKGVLLTVKLIIFVDETAMTTR